MLFVSICGLLSEAEEEQWIWGRWIKKLSGQVTRPLGKHVSQGEDSMCHPKPRAGSLSFLPRLYQMFFLLGVGALKTYNLARYGIIVFIYFFIVKWAKPPLHLLFLSDDQSSISLWLIPSNGNHSSLFTTERLQARNRWDEAHSSSAEIWTYSPQRTGKGRMTLCWCAENSSVKCVIVLYPDHLLQVS